MKTLTEKGLVVKKSNPAKYVLSVRTLFGAHLFIELYRAEVILHK